MEQTTLAGGRVLNHHAKGTCRGEVCPLHNPSDHEYRDYPLDWHDEWRVMIRRTENDQFQIDPDDFTIRNLKPGQTYILENSGYCRKCQVKLVSTHRHDFVQCPCGQFVDGGHDYLRRTLDLLDTSCIYTKES